MIKVSTTGMAVSSKTELWFPKSGQRGHGRRIIHLKTRFYLLYDCFLDLQLSKMGFYHIYFCFESIICILTKPFFNQFTIYELAYDFFFFFIKITNPVIAAITPTPHIILNHRQYNIPT